MDFHPNWSALATVDFRWKQFVTAASIAPGKHTNTYEKSEVCTNLNGDEVQNIYTNIVELGAEKQLQACEKSSSSVNLASTNSFRCSRHEVKSNSNKWASVIQDREKLMTRIMKEAESNNVESVSDLLKYVPNINFVDKFGWTLLMCAACAGAVDVVQLLLNNGADVNVCDKSGNSCMTVAKKHGHNDVVAAIEMFMRSRIVETRIHKPPNATNANLKVGERFYCEMCKQHFINTSRKKHETSTLHLFNSKPKASSTVYGIPETNKGYQILLRGGWDKERGLGPDGSGQKFPLKTVLKKDRKGLGGYRATPRVTHFPALDTTAVRTERPKVVSKRQREQNERKQRRKERNFRREFYSL